MDKRITQLVEATTLEKDDLLNIVDISDTTMSANGSTKKIEYANIMKAPPITNWDGWQETGHTWTKDADHKFIVTGDFTSFYQKGHKVRFMDTTMKYGVIGKVELISDDTVITLINTSDYAIVGLSITTNAISNVENPTGFPHWFNYVPTIVGFSVLPVGVYQWVSSGNSLLVSFRESTFGTSNSTSLSYTLPILVDESRLWDGTDLRVLDNGAVAVGQDTRVNVAGATTNRLDIRKNGALTSWTASGDKGIVTLTFQYRF